MSTVAVSSRARGAADLSRPHSQSSDLGRSQTSDHVVLRSGGLTVRGVGGSCPRGTRGMGGGGGGRACVGSRSQGSTCPASPCSTPAAPS